MADARNECGKPGLDVISAHELHARRIFALSLDIGSFMIRFFALRCPTTRCRWLQFQGGDVGGGEA
jgi:hypothetical protein